MAEDTVTTKLGDIRKTVLFKVFEEEPKRMEEARNMMDYLDHQIWRDTKMRRVVQLLAQVVELAPRQPDDASGPRFELFVDTVGKAAELLA